LTSLRSGRDFHGLLLGLRRIQSLPSAYHLLSIMPLTGQASLARIHARLTGAVTAGTYGHVSSVASNPKGIE
jgi:hypothetical protein